MPEINLHDLGARPGDKSNPCDTELASAIASAISTPNTEIIVPSGNWYHDDAHDIDGATNVTLKGGGTLIGTAYDKVIEANNCTGVTLSNISVSKDPHGFVHGTVGTVYGGGTSFDVALSKAWPTDLALQVEWITFYDSNWIPSDWQLDWSSSYFGTPTLSGDRMTLTVVVSTGTIAPTEGENIVVSAHKFTYSGFKATRCSDVTVSDFNVYSAAGVGLQLRQCDGTTSVSDLTVTPETGEYQSIAATGLNVIDCYGTMAIDRFTSRYTGDDAFNFRGSYARVSAINVGGGGAKAITIEAYPQKGRYKVGDQVQFFVEDNPKSWGTGTVDSITSASATWNADVSLVLDSGSDEPPVGTIVENLTAKPTITARDFLVENTRQRGGIIKAAGLDFADAVFRNVGGSALSIRATYDNSPAREAGGSTASTFDSIVATNTGYRTNSEGGAITIYAGNDRASSSQYAGFHENLTFSNIEIDGSREHGINIQSLKTGSFTGIEIKNIADNDGDIAVSNSTGITQSGNTIIKQNGSGWAGTSVNTYQSEGTCRGVKISNTGSVPLLVSVPELFGDNVFVSVAVWGVVRYRSKQRISSFDVKTDSGETTFNFTVLDGESP